MYGEAGPGIGEFLKSRALIIRRIVWQLFSGEKFSAIGIRLRIQHLNTIPHCHCEPETPAKQSPRLLETICVQGDCFARYSSSQ